MANLKALLIIGFGFLALCGCKDKKESQLTCNDTYVEIGGRVLKVPGRWLYLEKDGEYIKGICVPRETPIKVDRASFLHDIPFSGYTYKVGPKSYKDKVTYQFVFDVLPSRRRDNYTDITNNLSSQGKFFQDLPKELGFYKYENRRTYYISADENLKASDRPLLLYNCRNPKNYFKCDAEFLWKDNVLVAIEPAIHPHEGSLDVWKDLYPRILEQINVFDNARK